MFISAVDSTIVNVALPDIAHDLGARLGQLQWVIDGFLVALAGTLLLGSGLADRYGRRRVFLLGLAGFGATSILAALSQTAGELIAARVLMGVAAACVLPPALPLLAVMFPPAERPRALAVWTAVAGIGLALGPVLGGVLVQTLGWQAVFLVNVPVTIVAVPLGLRSLPESRRPGTPPLDLGGIALSMIALACVVYTLIEGVHTGWTHPSVLLTACVGVASGIAFFWVELRSAAPLFDVRVLTRRAVAGGALVILLAYLSFLGMLFVLPQYLRYVRHESTLASGLTLAPLGIACLVTAPMAPRAGRVLGRRAAIVAGMVVMAAGVGMLLLIHRSDGLVIVLISVALFGAMVPFTITLSTGVVMLDLGEAKAGDGGAINQLARQVGGALGVAIIGSVFAAVFANRIEALLPGFSAVVRHRAEESIQQAQKVIALAPPAIRAHLLTSISHSFDVAARVGFATTTGLLLVGAVVAAVTLGGYGRQVTTVISDPSLEQREAVA
jgi:EmrB/QacA subfamily drug resistance transporter